MKLPIYLDYMATTPVDSRVVQKMSQCLELSGSFGNPASRAHVFGLQAAELVEHSRQQIAGLMGAEAKEIIFTSGATEANNLAIKGAANFYHRKGKHIVTCKTEHKSVLDCCKFLEGKGFEVTYLTPQKNGLLDLNEFIDALRDDTILVSLMHVNNEIGVIHDIEKISKFTRERGIIFHVDATQSIGRIPLNLKQNNIDLLSFSAHKMYGPKGIGALYVRQNPRVRLEPLIHGGGHEMGLRSGTLPTHQIVGFAEACRIAKDEMEKEALHIKNLQEYFLRHLTTIANISLNGDAEQRVAGNLNVSFHDINNETLQNMFNNLAVSSGAACTSAAAETSHVLQALGVEDKVAKNTIRFCIGRYTTKEDIDFAIGEIKSLYSVIPNECEESPRRAYEPTDGDSSRCSG